MAVEPSTQQSLHGVGSVVFDVAPDLVALHGVGYYYQLPFCDTDLDTESEIGADTSDTTDSDMPQLLPYNTGIGQHGNMCYEHRIYRNDIQLRIRRYLRQRWLKGQAAKALHVAKKQKLLDSRHQFPEVFGFQ